MTENKINRAEEQQDFRKNQSTVDVTLLIIQLVQKSTEYNKPAWWCYVDLNVFDRLRRTGILQLLQDQDTLT